MNANIACYQEQNPDTQITISGMIDSLADSSIVNLPVACQLPVQQRLLRYPLLLDSTEREPVHARLSASGMGVSIMYPAILPTISGLDILLAGQGPFPAAEQFAARLLTLPTHAGVRRKDIQTMAATMRSLLG